MSSEILTSFYNCMMPLFMPQAEKLVDSILPHLLNPVSAMTKVSYIIEDMAAMSQGVLDLHISFQFLSRFSPQQARYDNIIPATQGTWLYYAAYQVLAMLHQMYPQSTPAPAPLELLA